MKKINVNLYGGKSIFKGCGNNPLSADITYCDECNNCSFYKNKKCFNANRLTSRCKYGRVEKIEGYTSRSKKYYSFESLYKTDPTYHLLDAPLNIIGSIGDNIVLNINGINIDENNEIINDVKFFSIDKELMYIPKNLFTNDLIKKICDFKLIGMWGGEIEDYQNKTIPKFLSSLKRDFNDIYVRFINEYPEYNRDINYIGRYAYINSLKDGVKIKDSNDKFFEKQGDYLLGSFSSCFLPFGAKDSEIKIKINSEMTYKITDNCQVDDNTVFED